MRKYQLAAKKILQEMSVKEKIGQIAQIASGYSCYSITENGEIVFDEKFKNIVSTYGGIGAISGILRADPWTNRHYGTGITADMREAAINKFQQYLRENTRLKIPALIEIESSHGLQALGSVLYPTGLCSAASFNPKLYKEVMKNIGDEIKLSGNHIAFLTLIDLARDPRWGRCEECLGEDPYLASQMAKAAVDGIKDAGAMVCAKHYVASGIAEGGINCNTVNIGERELEEIYLPTAKAVVDAGCDFVMTAYNPIDGVYCHANKKLLKDILREKLNFDGVIISDGCGVSILSNELKISKKDAAALCLKSGIDLSLADSDSFTYLEEALEEGLITINDIDEACLRVLEKKFEIGLFDEKPLIPGTLKSFNSDRHFEKSAYDMAAESITLIKNDSLLPISKDTKVALIGENADDIYHILGDYTSERLPEEGCTIRAAFEKTFGNLAFSKGWSFNDINDYESALEVAKDCDVICITLGGTSKRDYSTNFLSNGSVSSVSSYIDCGEGISLSRLELPPQQLELLRKLKKLNKPIVSIVIMGRAYILKEVEELSDAVLIGWYPGQEGADALADIVTGKVNPSGKLPITLPYDSSVLPVFYNSYDGDNKYFDCPRTVLHHFGYGLSYSTFKYDNLNINFDGSAFKVIFTVQNTSNIPGKEVAQLYINISGDSVAHRVMELKAFEKITLSPNEIKTINFIIKKEELNLYAPISPKLSVYIGNPDNIYLSNSLHL